MSSNASLLKSIGEKLKPTVIQEDHDYQLLSALFEEQFAGTPFVSLPIDGEVARAEHILEPLKALERMDRQTQEILDQLLEEAETLSANTATTRQQILTQLNYLRSEVNYWKLQKQPRQGDVIEFVEDLSPGAILPVKNFQSQMSQLNQVQYVPGTTVQAGNNEQLPSPFYTFGQPFLGEEVADPAAALRQGDILHLQGIILTNQTTDLNSYLQSSFESLNGLQRLSANPFIWYQERLNSTDDLTLTGQLILRFNPPPQLSYIRVNIDPLDIIDRVDIIDVHGQTTHLTPAEILYFTPQLVQEIRFYIQDTTVPQKLSYPLQAYIIRTATNGGTTDYVFYRDQQARQINGAQ